MIGHRAIIYNIICVNFIHVRSCILMYIYSCSVCIYSMYIRAYIRMGSRYSSTSYVCVHVSEWLQLTTPACNVEASRLDWMMPGDVSHLQYTYAQHWMSNGSSEGVIFVSSVSRCLHGLVPFVVYSNDVHFLRSWSIPHHQCHCQSRSWPHQCHICIKVSHGI